MYKYTTNACVEKKLAICPNKLPFSCRLRGVFFFFYYAQQVTLQFNCFFFIHLQPPKELYTVKSMTYKTLYHNRQYSSVAALISDDPYSIRKMCVLHVYESKVIVLLQLWRLLTLGLALGGLCNTPHRAGWYQRAGVCVYIM